MKPAFGAVPGGRRGEPGLLGQARHLRDAQMRLRRGMHQRERTRSHFLTGQAGTAQLFPTRDLRRMR
jgi:hypothetical protein